MVLETSLLLVVVVAAILVAVVRVPFLRSRGTTRLRTDAEPSAVREAFAGPTPPPLALQWGIAEEIRAVDGSVYRISHLFGLSTVEMAVNTETETRLNGGYQMCLEITLGDDPWATYTVDIIPQDDGTVVEYEYVSDRRFDLVSAVRGLFARQYREGALATQDYTTTDREGRLGV